MEQRFFPKSQGDASRLGLKRRTPAGGRENRQAFVQYASHKHKRNFTPWRRYAANQEGMPAKRTPSAGREAQVRLAGYRKFPRDMGVAKAPNCCSAGRKCGAIAADNHEL